MCHKPQAFDSLQESSPKITQESRVYKADHEPYLYLLTDTAKMYAI